MNAPTRNGLRVSRESAGTLGNVQAIEAFGLGGWSLGVQHVLDVEQQTIFFGDGRRWNLADGREEPGILAAVAGTGLKGNGGDGGPASAAELNSPTGLSTTRDGSLLVADSGNCRIRKVDPGGFITTVAGSVCGDTASSVGDGLPAELARLASPTKAIEGPNGAIYIADKANHRVRRVLEDGTIETVVGNGSSGCDDLGSEARFAALGNPQDIAFDAEGNLLVLSRYEYWTPEANEPENCDGIYKVDVRGELTRIVDREYEQCDDPAEENCPGLLRNGMALEAQPDGSILFSDSNHISRRPAGGLSDDGTDWIVAGTPGLWWQYGFTGDGEPASPSTALSIPFGLASARDGSLFFSDSVFGRIRKMGPDRIVTTVAGGGPALPLDEFPAKAVALGRPWGVALDAAGEELYFSDAKLEKVFKLTLSAISGTNELFVPSRDGSVIYVFDPTGRHLRTEDSVTRQAVWTFRYTGYPAENGAQAQYLTEVEDAYGNIVQIERQADGTPIAIVSAFGQRTELSVAPTTGYLQEVRRSLESGVEAVDMSMAADGLLQWLDTPKGQRYTYAYDVDGRLERVNDPEQGELVLDFVEIVPLDAEEGHRVTLTTAESVKSSTEVNVLPTGEIRQKVTLPSGHLVEVERGTDGSFTWSYPDETEVVVETGPDPRLGPKSPILSKSRLETPEDHLEYVVERDRQVSVSGGDSLTLVTQVDTVRINGRESVTAYDASTRTVSRTSAEGRTSETVLDTLGRVSEVRAPSVESVFVDYDPQGHLSEVRQGAGLDERKVTLTYDADGFVETVTDPLQRETRYEYDKVGRVTKTILPDLREIGYEYDLNGNLVRITPPARPDHLFDHNDVDQVSSYEPPDLEPASPAVPSTTYGYDDDHRLTTITRPDGQVVRVEYDSGGRVDFLESPYGLTDLVYDGETGKLASMTEPGGASLSYSYDGPWLKGVTVGGPFSASIELEADRPSPGFPATNFWLGRLEINGDPSTEVAYEYDQDGLATRIEELDVYYEEAPSGRWLGSHVLDTGTRITRNGFGELERLEAGYFGPPAVTGGQAPFVGEALLDISYERDKLGRIVQKTETTRPAVGSAAATEVVDYDYDDDRGWLVEVKRDGVVTEAYGYDANGNRTSWSNDFGTGTATYDDQDRLLTHGAASYTYTENGELRTKSEGGFTTTYTYDVFGNLRAVRLPDGLQIEYLVDASNRRIGKKVSGTLVKRYLYLGGLSPIAELDAAGNVETQYVYGSRVNVPDYFVRGGVTYRIFTDHLGSVRFVLDASSGAVAQEMRYDSFGRVLLDTNPGFQPFGFAGGLYDYQTGLVRFGARDYDGEVGRWTAKDPIGFAGGDTGLYGYVFSDPVNGFDPYGLFGVLDGVQLGLDVVGLVPGLGEPADIANGFISLARGDKVGAALSFAAAVPLAGMAATLGKGARYADEAASALKQASSAPSGGRRAAFREAKRHNGIPASQQPDRVIRSGTPEGDAAGLRRGENVRLFEFTDEHGNVIHIREDLPTTYPDGGSQGPHFNSGPAGEKLRGHHYFDE